MTMTTTRHFLLIWLGILLGLVASADQTIVWIDPGQGGMEPRYASVGDTFTFVFNTGSHNVYIHPSEDCDPTGSYLVGTMGDGATQYTFRDRDVGRRVFADQIGNNCSKGGLLLVVFVSPAVGEPVTSANDDVMSIDATVESQVDRTTSSALTLFGGARLDFFRLARSTTSITALLMWTPLRVGAASLTVLMTAILMG